MNTGLIYKNFDSVLVSNTTTETEIFSFNLAEYQQFTGKSDVGLLGPNQAVRVVVHGLINQNAGGTPTTTLKLYLGGTANTVALDPAQGFPYFKATWTIIIKAPDTTQSILGEFYAGDTNGNAGESRMAFATSSKTVDLLVDSSIVVKATLSTANVSFELTKQAAYVEFI